ncbi:MAG TPA: cupin domain-containing protein [Opitutaceae bacterium]|jgi:quercetin dioxygenase-like cupin family protein
MSKKAHRPEKPPFRWEDVPLLAYKEEGTHFRAITRQVLFGEDEGAGAELRYFEIAPGGHSTLERHQHSHCVMILRGSGRALVGAEVVAVAAHDLVRVPPMTWHQFRADKDALGFLCLVRADRDRPQRPGAADLAQIGANPAAAAFVRT